MATKIRGGNIGAGAIDEIESGLEARIAKPDNIKIRKAISDLVDSDYVGARSSGGGGGSTSISEPTAAAFAIALGG
tara:strand:- start:1017 stop:1244 length:228 start_codon:yes stop_codon:yes gene_type:complete